MTNEISEMHQKVDDRQRKKFAEHSYNLQNSNLFLFLTFRLFTVQNLRLKEKSSIVEFKSHLSLGSFENESVRDKTSRHLVVENSYEMYFFMFMRQSSTIHQNKKKLEAENYPLSVIVS